MPLEALRRLRRCGQGLEPPRPVGDVTPGHRGPGQHDHPSPVQAPHRAESARGEMTTYDRLTTTKLITELLLNYY